MSFINRFFVNFEKQKEASVNMRFSETYSIDASFFSATCCPLIVSIIKKRLIYNTNVNQPLYGVKDDTDKLEFT